MKINKKGILSWCLLTAISMSGVLAQSINSKVESYLSYTFPSALTASATGSKIAWVFSIQGIRNVFVAEGPGFTVRQLTKYNEDDGQEITGLSISADGKWVVFVRGGDHNSTTDENLPINPSSNPFPPKVQIWSVAFSGGDPVLLGEGDKPSISPKNDQVLFIQGGQVSSAPIDGSAPAKNMFKARGSINSLEWSPDASQLAFVSQRGDHSFIGIFTSSTSPLRWMAPDFSYDFSPKWSPDGSRIAFIRTPGAGGAPDSVMARKHHPWSIWVADIKTGIGTQLWTAPKTLEGSFPSGIGGANLLWPAGNRIVFTSYQDGWPHLYSVDTNKGNPLLLTPGPFMVEQAQLSRDGKWVVFCANDGASKDDRDRRHIVKVTVDNATPEIVTSGDGIEWTPFFTGDGSTIACISATSRRPPLPAVINSGKPMSILGEDKIPVNFPTKEMATPRSVTFESTDGTIVHGQLFEPTNVKGKRPAIVYLHGGPQRQILLGWHYSDYYSNTYAINQYLTSLGFVVLSVNYRLGIGYGFDFNQPKSCGPWGAAEYKDIHAAGIWLGNQPGIDAKRIGIYGGSYGGFLTAMALARDSKIFAAGVDIHGVHDWTIDRTRNLTTPDKFERAPDADLALKTAWESSPVSAISTWTSPALIIHGDDDRTVKFSQSVDLVKRLRDKNIPVETMVIVDDSHHWRKHSNEVEIATAIAEFFKRKLMP
jgi:dipeptidyl aminopeptidase/acylaminoacyl peptidase